MACPPSIAIPSDLPPPFQNVSMMEMNDPNSPFLHDAVYSKLADPTSLRNGEFIAKNAVTALKVDEQRKIMQKISGVEVQITHFQNWGATNSTLLMYAKPKSSDEVCKVVHTAKLLRVKVGMGGAYHTWSPSFPDSGGLLINTCDILLADSDGSDWTKSRMKLNASKDQVTMVPGVTTGQLMKFFLDNNVCIKADVVLPSVTYGGLLSGGCHGVGKNEASMSDWVYSMVIVDGNGDLKNVPDDFVDPNDPDLSRKEILKAASASLGTFGVIVEITLEVQPMCNADVTNDFNTKLRILNGSQKSMTELTALLQDYESIEMFWFPFNSVLDPFLKKKEDSGVVELSGISDKEIRGGKLLRWLPSLWDAWEDDLWIRKINFTEKPYTQDPGIPIWSRVLDAITGSSLSLAKAVIGSTMNKITPFTLALGFKMLKWQYGEKQENAIVKMPWAIHYRDAIDLSHVYDMEFAFPININNPQILVDAVKVVEENTHLFSTKGKFYPETDNSSRIGSYPFNTCMELRIIKKSEALLCPASLGDEDNILYIEVLSLVNTPGTEEFFQTVAAQWKVLNGIPHWQKQWTFLDDNGSMINYLQTKYGENLTKFKTIRDKMAVDPSNMFINSVTSALLDL